MDQEQVYNNIIREITEIVHEYSLYDGKIVFGAILTKATGMLYLSTPEKNADALLEYCVSFAKNAALTVIEERGRNNG